MSQRRQFRAAAFTLTELLVVVGLVGVLVAMLLPTLSGVKRRAILVTCSAQLRDVAGGLLQYAAVNEDCLPPFSFSDQAGNLPLSGHWGGPSQPGDPGMFGRENFSDVNLWFLLGKGYLYQRQLICPAADGALRSGRASYFPYSDKFSTYCLRFPYSSDVFRFDPSMMNYGGLGVLGAYRVSAGGYPCPLLSGDLPSDARIARPLPLARTSLVYREDNPARPGDVRAVSFTNSPILSDTFWLGSVDMPAPAAPAPGVKTFAVRGSWCHQDKFNVALGGGAVRTVRDDGTVAANRCADGVWPVDDGKNDATYAIAVWRYFEDWGGSTLRPVGQ